MCWPRNSAGLRQHFDSAIHVHAAVGQLARALAGVDEQRADAAVDVDPGVALGCACGVREVVELVFVFLEPLRHRLQERRALMKGQLAQIRAADVTCVLQHGAVVEASADELAITSFVVASRNVTKSRVPVCHFPAAKLCSCIFVQSVRHHCAADPVRAAAEQCDPRAALVGYRDFVDSVRRARHTLVATAISSSPSKPGAESQSTQRPPRCSRCASCKRKQMRYPPV